jgi:hypothetical protein
VEDSRRIDLILKPPGRRRAARAGRPGLPPRVQIDANLVWSNGPVTVVTAIATFTAYSVRMPISTKIKVPCSGSGVMNFIPALP